MFTYTKESLLHHLKKTKKGGGVFKENPFDKTCKQVAK